MTNWNNYREFKINGTQFAMIYDSKIHHWRLFLGDTMKREHDISWPRKKGDAVIQFIEALLRVRKDANK